MTLEIRREDCVAVLQGYFRSSNFTLEECVTKASEMSGSTGRYYKMTASVCFDGRMKEVQFFAKTPPSLKSQRELILRVFQRELVFYKYIAPEMIASLPPGVILPLPRCTFARDTLSPGFIPVPGSKEEELIVFEDVSQRGFVHNKHLFMDLQHCEVVLKALARFHAASILLNLRKRSGTENGSPEGAPYFSDELWNLDKANAVVTKSAKSTAKAACGIWPQRFGGQRDRILASMNEAWARLNSEGKTNPKYVRAFIHGDLHRWNLMFSYEKGQNGEERPVEALLLDMQNVQFLPPIYDVLSFLHVSTRRSFRDQNTMMLLEYYHKELSGSMPQDLCDRVLSFKSLLESYEDLKIVGPLVSSSYLPLVLELSLTDRKRPEEVVTDLLNDRGERIIYDCETSQEYREVVEESYRECFEGLGLWE